MRTDPADYADLGFPYRVEYTVKGAYTIRTKEFHTLSEAAQCAARWRASNSTGDYVAWVFGPGGKELAA